MDLERTCTLIQDDEGYRERPYLDTKQNVTIGIGDNLSLEGITTLEQANKKYPNGISIEQARTKAQVTITRIANSLPYYIKVFNDLDDVRQAVLIDMAYNMGVNGLLKFHDTLNFILAEDYVSASKEMLRSDWAIIDVPNRAKRLSIMMLTGEWPDYV